jgi:hypothetical protein
MVSQAMDTNYKIILNQVVFINKKYAADILNNKKLNMKQFIVLLSFMVFNLLTQAQGNLAIKQGNTLKYSVTVEGQTFPMYAHIDSLDTNNFAITWSFESGRSGRFVMRRSSLDSASLGYWYQPIDGQELLLPPTQNVLFLSRFIYSTLQKDKTAVFDGYEVSVKPSVADNIFKLNDKAVDALCLGSESGTKIWILNDPVTPLILKIEGNPFGVDVELTDIN